MVTKFNQFLNEEYRTKGAKGVKNNNITKLDEINKRIEKMDISFLEYMHEIMDNHLEKYILKPKQLFDTFYEIDGIGLVAGAIMWNRIDILKKLRNKGVYLNAYNNCLEYAIPHSAYESVIFLINEIKDNSKELSTILFDVVDDFDDDKEESIKIVKLLLVKGANMTYKRDELISICTKYKKYNILKTLIDYGLDTSKIMDGDEKRLVDSINKIEEFKNKRK